jgi:hypothetical protein
MLVQWNHDQPHHIVEVAATDVPLPGFGPAGHRPVVSVFGHPGRVAELAGHLPAGWSMRRPRGLDDVHFDDIVLIGGAVERDIDAARAVLPRHTALVAVVDEFASAAEVAAVLTAGADVCVRAGRPAILASHLVACRRRQVTDRWAGHRPVPA